MSRDVDGCRRICALLEALLSQQRMPTWQAYARLINAVLESMTHPTDKAAAQLHDVLLGHEAFATIFMPGHWGKFLAENYLAVSDPVKALAANERAFEFAQTSDEHWTDSELLRVRGVALAMRDGVDCNDEAEACLRRAIEDARSRSARSFELRAAMSLARFLREQGRSTEARETLAPIYGWFTEGFDTPDLIDARALLDELA